MSVENERTVSDILCPDFQLTSDQKLIDELFLQYVEKKELITELVSRNASKGEVLEVIEAFAGTKNMDKEIIRIDRLFKSAFW